MTTKIRRFEISPNSELAQLLDEAGEDPVVLDYLGRRFRLVEETSGDIWMSYDPVQVKAALEASAGALVDVDRQHMLDDIRTSRKQRCRGRHL